MKVSKDMPLPCDDRFNNKGEADYAVWFHAAKSTCESILVVSADTDVYMFGLPLIEMGYLKLPNGDEKSIIVELEYNNAQKCSYYNSQASTLKQIGNSKCYLFVYFAVICNEWV